MNTNYVKKDKEKDAKKSKALLTHQTVQRTPPSTSVV